MNDSLFIFKDFIAMISNERGTLKLLRGDSGQQESLRNSQVVYTDSDIATPKADPFSGGNLNELLSTFGAGPPR